MDSHKNARLTARSRELLVLKVVQQGVRLKLAAASFSVTEKTAGKWVRRYREQGVAGLADRSSRPHRLYRPTASDQIERVEQLRRQRWTGYRIARTTGLSRSTVSRILRRLHLNRIRDLEPAPPIQRYEHAAPGDLLHLDIKKLGRIVRPSHRVTGDRRACFYDHSDQRSQQLHSWLHHYNWHRPHASLNHQPPISRARLDRYHLLSLHS